MISMIQRIASAALRLRAYRDRDFYEKRKAASNQMSLWGEDDEAKHPRNEVGEFAKKDESSVILSKSEIVKPIEAVTKPEVKEEKKMNTGNGTVDRDALLVEIEKEVGHLTDAKHLKRMMLEDFPTHMETQATKYMLNNPSPIPELFEKMVSGGYATSDLSLSDQYWPTPFRKWQDAIDQWRSANPKTDEIKFMGNPSRVQIKDPKIGSFISAPIEEFSVEGINIAVKELRKRHKDTAKAFRSRIAAERSTNNE